MKPSIFPSATLVSLSLLCAAFCAAPSRAQITPRVGFATQLPFRAVSPAQAEAFAVAAPIRLSLSGVTLQAALDELQKQSGVALDYGRNVPAGTLEKLVSINIETPSFDRAFAKILDEAGVKASLIERERSGARSVNWSAGEVATQAIQSETGLFRVRLKGLNTVLSKTASFNEAGEPKRSQSNGTDVSLLLKSDARFDFIGAPQVRFTRAQDDKGRSLLVPPNDEPKRQLYYSFYGDRYQREQTNLRLLPAAADATVLAHLEGDVTYVLIAKTEAWELPDLMAQKEWKRAFKSGDESFEMSVQPMLTEREGLSLRVQIESRRALANGEVPHPMLMGSRVAAALRVEDANGLVLLANASNSYPTQKLDFTTNLRPLSQRSRTEALPEKPALPLKFVFEAPLDVVQTQVPFSFENVPLP